MVEFSSYDEASNWAESELIQHNPSSNMDFDLEDMMRDFVNLPEEDQQFGGSLELNSDAITLEKKSAFEPFLRIIGH